MKAQIFNVIGTIFSIYKSLSNINYLVAPANYLCIWSYLLLTALNLKPFNSEQGPNLHHFHLQAFI